MSRRCGILLPISSLPSKYGIGAFSKEAYEFVDFLAASGQKLWQVLPMGPTGYGDSPYQSFSTFAGNPYFIDLDTLVQEKLLLQEECEACDWGDDPEKVDYEKIYTSRFVVLKKAFERKGGETVEVVNNSTISKELRDKLTAQTTNKELGEMFVSLAKGKELVCHRQVYARSIPTKTGRPFEVPAALIGFEFAE